MQLTTDIVKSKLMGLVARMQRAEGSLAMLASRRAELTVDVAMAKARQGLHEEMQQLFQLLQERAHERSVGAFERLLSAILNDVLPAEGKIRLGLSIKNNTPALDVLLQREGTPNLEDVYDDNGGGVTNIVCAGLRFAALSRTKNRRFMVLDEPDGWLGEHDVSPFVKVLADVSKATKTQTVFVSHRPPERFEGLVNLIELSEQADGSPVAQLRQPTVTQWEFDEEPGIRAIELINVRRHRHTILPLPPGATALIGNINGGKSTAVIGAMKAVCYGESSDSMISHGADEARIILHIENRQRLVWSRKPSRSPVVVYELYQGDSNVPVEKGRPGRRNEAPEWVQKLMCITRVDDLDIQLGNQKRPVFLLDDPASRRAQILSVGRESSYLPLLMKEYESVKTEDRETVRSGEAELMKVTYRLQAQESFATVKSGVDDFHARFVKVEELLRRAELLEGFVRVMGESTSRLSALAELDVLPPVPVVPLLPDAEGLKQAIFEMQTSSRRLSAFGVIPGVPDMPSVPDSAELRAMGLAMKKCQDALRALSDVPGALPAVSELPDVAELASFLSSLGQHRSTIAGLDENLKGSAEELAQLAKEKAELTEESGGCCPLCGHELEEEHQEHAHAV